MIKGTYYSVYDGSSARNFIKDLENSIEGILEEINDNSKITAQFLQNEIQSLLMIESFILKYSTYSDMDCLNLPDKAMFDSESDEKMIDAIKSLKMILDDYQDILRRDIGEERENLKFLLSACSKKCEMSRENWYKYLHKIHKDINSIQPENFYPPEKATFEADVVEYLNALHFTKKSLKNQLFAKMLTMYKIMNVRKAWITHNVDNFPIEIFDFFEKKAKEDHDDRDFFMENHSDELSHKLKQLKSMIEFEGYYFSHNNEKNQLLYLEFLSGNILSVVNCENLDEKNIVKLSSYKEIVKSSESSGIIILNTSDKEIPISCPGNTKLKSLATFLKNKFENLAMKKNNEQAPPLGKNYTEMFTPSTISFLLVKILKDDGKSVVNSKKISKLIKNEDRLRNLVTAELKDTMTVERKKEISPVMAFRALKSIFRMQETSILGILYQQCKDINDDEKLTSLIDIYTKLLSTKEFNILRIIIKLYENLQQKCITSKNIQHNINKNFHEMLFFPQDLTTQMVKDFDFKTNLLLRVAQSLPKAFDIKIPNAEAVKINTNDEQKELESLKNPINNKITESLIKSEKTFNASEESMVGSKTSDISELEEVKIEKHEYHLFVPTKFRPRAPGNLSRNPKATLNLKSEICEKKPVLAFNIDRTSINRLSQIIAENKVTRQLKTHDQTVPVLPMFLKEKQNTECKVSQNTTFPGRLTSSPLPWKMEIFNKSQDSSSPTGISSASKTKSEIESQDVNQRGSFIPEDLATMARNLSCRRTRLMSISIPTDPQTNTNQNLESICEENNFAASNKDAKQMKKSISNPRSVDQIGNSEEMGNNAIESNDSSAKNKKSPVAQFKNAFSFFSKKK